MQKGRANPSQLLSKTWTGIHFSSVQEAIDYGLSDGRVVPMMLREKKQKYYTSPWK
ncbi:hypothetical protein Tsubulata_012470, partial [Turnera subulata]